MGNLIQIPGLGSTLFFLDLLIVLECSLRFWLSEMNEKNTGRNPHNSDEEQRFMYKINQGHLTVFCIVFV